MTKKAVILAGGLGSRMRRNSADVELKGSSAELADKGLKGLIPINGYPFLDYVTGELVRAGFGELCLVIPPDCQELEKYCERASQQLGAQIIPAVQEEPKGTADALLAAESVLSGGPFVMCNCDNYYPGSVLRDLHEISDKSCYAVGFSRNALVENSNFGADRVDRFAVLTIEGEDNLAEIVEKPENPEDYADNGDLRVSMNLYRFTTDIFDACRAIEAHPERREYELTDAVRRLLREETVPFRVVFSEGPVVDLTARGDVVGAADFLPSHPAGFRPMANGDQ